MRLWEIVQQQRVKIKATRLFFKQLPEWEKAYPQLKSNLKRFVEFRETEPYSREYNQKDTNFNNDGLKEKIKHVHLVHGRVILFYRMIPNELYLYLFTTHADYKNSSGSGALVKRLNNISPSDFYPFEKPIEIDRLPHMSDDQKKTIEHLLWEMATDDETRVALQAATENNLAPVMDFITSLFDGIEEATVVTTFGGQAKFCEMIGNILKNTQVK